LLRGAGGSFSCVLSCIAERAIFSARRRVPASWKIFEKAFLPQDFHRCLGYAFAMDRTAMLSLMIANRNQRITEESKEDHLLALA
jgi:hypothetical protein